MDNKNEQKESLGLSESSLKKRTIIGRIILAIYFIASIITIGVLEYVQVLPNKFVFLGAFVLLVLFAAIGAIMKFKKSSKLFYIGSLHI